MGTSNIIVGVDKSDDQLIYTGTSTMLINSNKDLSIVAVTLAAITAGGSVFGFTGSTNKIEIRDCIIANSKSLGSVAGGDVFILRDVLLTGNTEGITFTGTINRIVITDNIWVSNVSTFTCISIPSGTYSTILIARNLFEVASTQTGLNISTGITITNGNLSMCMFTGVGTYLTGFLHTTTGWLFTANQGIANRQREFFVPTTDINGLALTTPTTSAAASSFLSGSGARFLTFRGGNNQDDGAAFTFQVPSDYFSGGRFDLNGTTDTGVAVNIKIFMAITEVPNGDSFSTIDETGLFSTFAVTTAFNRIETSITPITTTFAPNELFIIKIWRDPDDAADTALLLSYYLNNIQFVYNSI